MARISILLCAIALILVQTITGSAQTPTNSSENSPENGRSLLIQSLPSAAKRYALIIGIDKYEDPKITTLKGGTNDARALADALKEYAGFPADQVILLTNDQPPERQPKRNTILELLSNLASAARKDNGLLLISFAGHGIERGGKPFLLSADARLGNDNDLDLLEETAVSVMRMKERIKGIDQVVMILDACRNDPSAGRSANGNTLTDSMRKSFNFDTANREVKAFATLYAASPGEISYEFRDKNQGYFTWALVEAFKGNVTGVANEKGELTLGKLVKYLEERVPKLVALNSGKQQKPHLVFEGYRPDELVLAVVPTNPKERESRYWDQVKESKSPAEIKTYIDKYPEGEYIALANARIKELQTSKRTLTMDNFSSAPSASPASNAEITFWDTIKNSNDPADFQAYLNRYPNGTYVELARNRVNGRSIAQNNQQNNQQQNSQQKNSQPNSYGKNEFDINGTWQELDNYCAGSTIYISKNGYNVSVSGEKKCQGGEQLQWTAIKTICQPNKVGYKMMFNGMEVLSDVVFHSDTEATKTFRTSKGDSGTVRMKKISR